jgi:hypothetical protein
MLYPSVLRKTDFYLYLGDLIRSGVQPEVRILVDNVSEEEAYRWERFFVMALGRRDLGEGCLCNMSDGGSGACAGRGKSHDQLHNHRIGEAHFGVPETAEARRMNSLAKKADGRVSARCQELAISQRMAIEAFDLETGVTVLDFESQRDAARNGYNQGAVSQCVRGRKKQYKGYGWRYA